MGAKAEYVERLIEDLQASQRRFAEMTVSKWAQVDQLTLATGLIPRFGSELRSAGLEPVYRVVSSNYNVRYANTLKNSQCFRCKQGS